MSTAEDARMLSAAADSLLELAGEQRPPRDRTLSDWQAKHPQARGRIAAMRAAGPAWLEQELRAQLEAARRGDTFEQFLASDVRLRKA